MYKTEKDFVDIRSALRVTSQNVLHVGNKNNYDAPFIIV